MSHAADYATRSWTNDKGDTIEARLLRVSGKTAILNQEGQVIRAPMDRLSKADRDWIARTKELKKWREWTLADGSQRRAIFVDFEDDELKLKDREETFSIKFDELKEADRELVAEVFNSGLGGLDAATDFTPTEKVTREWTDFSGKKIEAEFRGTEGDKIVLFFKDKEWRVPLWRFSDEDKEFVAKAQRETLQPKQIASRGPRTPFRSPASPPRSFGSQPNRALEMMREQQQQMARDHQERARKSQERFAQMQRDQVEQARVRAEESRIRQERMASSRPTFSSSTFPTPRGPSHSAQPSVPSRSQTEYREVIICQSCKHQNEASSFKAGDKCRGCGVRIDMIQNEDGSFSSGSTDYWVGNARNWIFGGLFVAGLLGGLIRKFSG
ncbi:MAG: SHD1 domain-containing protein [Aeoliella sp.]